MRLSRLFIAEPLSAHSEILADAAVSHYIRDVLRLRVNDAVCLFDGRGGEYAAHVLELQRHGVRLAVGAFDPRAVESPLWVELGLGVSRGERMDFAIQKAVELGVARITPLITERTVVQLNADKRVQRREHWQKIAIAACEQSGRCQVPELAPIRSLADWLPNAEGMRLYCDPRAEHGLTALSAPANRRVCLLSGPEGGFSDDERAQARYAGFQGVQLGPRVLRTETAVLTALTAVQLLWGDLG